VSVKVNLESPAKSELGSWLPNHFLPKGAILMAFKGYFDGSSDSVSDKYVTLAGVGSTDDLWNPFEAEWKRILADRDPQAAYLHMKEAIVLKDEFSADRGWTKEKVTQLIGDLLAYLQTLDKNKFRFFNCAVDVSAHKRVINSGVTLHKIPAICVKYCPEESMAWYFREFHNFTEHLHFYFDQGESYRHIFEIKWIKRKKSSGRNLLNHWHLVKTVTTAVSADTPALQVADLCAWASNRNLRAQTEAPGRDYEALFDVIKTIVPTTQHWFNEDRLRGNCKEELKLPDTL
jgi:Protein of unknown function (DUF3800)